MAGFEVSGMDELLSFFNNIANVPTSVKEGMLNAGAEIVMKAQKTKAPRDTGTMGDSIAADKPRVTHDGGSITFYPKGTHHISKKSRYRNTGGASRTVTNAEVGFIHEFGAPSRNIPASQWMQSSNEQSADAAVEAAADVYENYIEKL